MSESKRGRQQSVVQQQQQSSNKQSGNSSSGNGSGMTSASVQSSPGASTVTHRPQLYTRKISVTFVEEAAQQLEGELLAQQQAQKAQHQQYSSGTTLEDIEVPAEAWEVWGNETNKDGYSSAIRRISHHIQEANRSRRISAVGGLTEEERQQQEALSKQRRSSRRQPVIFIPHIIAYKGDVSKMREVIEQQMNGDTSFLHNLYDYTPGKSLLTKDEEEDELYIPPPQLPKLIRAALKIQNVNNMTRDQRWLLQHAFQQSSVLHYACAADSYDMVSLLLDHGHNPNILNAAGKPPEYYTQSDDIRELLWSKEGTYANNNSNGNTNVRRSSTTGGINNNPQQQRKVSQHAEKLQQSIRQSILEQEQKEKQLQQQQQQQGQGQQKQGGPTSKQQRPSYAMSNSDPKLLQVLKDTAPPMANSRPLPKAPSAATVPNAASSSQYNDDLAERESIASDATGMSTQSQSRRLSTRRMSRVLNARRHSDASSVASHDVPPANAVKATASKSQNQSAVINENDKDEDEEGELIPGAPTTTSAHKKMSVIEMHRSRRGSVNQPVKPSVAATRVSKKDRQSEEGKTMSLDDLEVDATSSPVHIPTSVRQSYHQPREFHFNLTPPPLPTSPPPPLTPQSPMHKSMVPTPEYAPPPPPVANQNMTTTPTATVKFMEPPPSDGEVIELLLPVTSSRPIVTRRLSVANTGDGDNKLQSVTLVEQEGQVAVMKEPKKALTPSARRASIAAMKKQQQSQMLEIQQPNGKKINVRRSMLFDKKVFNEKGERVLSTRKAKYGTYVPPPKDIVEERQRNRMKDFLSNFIPLEEVAGKVLAENSNSNQSSFTMEASTFHRSNSPLKQASKPTTEGHHSHIDLYHKVVSDERNLTFSAARSATTLSLIYENMDILHQSPKKVDPTAVSFREMLWRKAGARMNEGLYDGPTMRLSKLRQEAYEDGLKELKREFRSYADRDDWEAVEMLQQDAMNALESLRFHGDDDLFLEESSLQQD